MSVHWYPQIAKKVTLGPVPTVITYGTAHTRCPECGFTVRGDKHESGQHHVQAVASRQKRKSIGR